MMFNVSTVEYCDEVELLFDSVTAPQGAAMSMCGVLIYVNESCHCECLFACPHACVHGRI